VLASRAFESAMDANGRDAEARKRIEKGGVMDEEKERIATAKRAIDDAQRDVTDAISEISAADRADKRHATDRLKTALERLRGAQTDLSRLDDLLAR
jgi:hypothetical protein